VTVLPTDLAGTGLPDILGGVVAANMLGHLSPDERRALWRIVGERLVDGGVAAIGLQPPARPETIPHTLFGTVVVGRRSYEGWGGAEPTGEETVRWRMVWRVLEDGKVVEERTADAEWWTVSETAVMAELSAVGLEASAGASGLVIARKAGR
jgi:hypothetical protein